MMPLVGERPVPDPVRKAIEAAGGSLSKSALSGLWLYFSALEESHRISQELDTAEGSFWHGIMHRREPDPENAAYWFRRVGRHPIFPALAAAAPQISGEVWDPFAFIDYCEEARRRPGSDMEAEAMRIQLAEWRLLMQYCLEQA